MNRKELHERMNDYHRAHHKSIVEAAEEFANITIDDMPSVEVDLSTNEIEPSAPAPGPDMGISQLLIDLINDEWEAIKGYNDFIATATSEEGYDDIISVIKDIAAEENVHVGQLQKVLEKLSPNAAKIAEGEVEGADQLNQQDNVEQ